MRSHQELLREIQVRKALGLPRIELTPQERSRAFGDPSLRDGQTFDEVLVERFKSGLPMSVEHTRRAKRLIKLEVS